MIHPWHDISIGEETPEIVNAIIEIPKDSKLKYELDKETGLLKLDRYMFSAVHYPGDYGFIPRTLWEDGDPLDVCIITQRATVPMALCKVKVIGVIRMKDNHEMDNKIIAVHMADPTFSIWNDISDIPKHFIEELQNFLETYKTLENKEVEIMEIRGREEAYKDIAEAQRLYGEKYAYKE
jgi:inorganic pyrophosphatase